MSKPIRVGFIDEVDDFETGLLTGDVLYYLVTVVDKNSSSEEKAEKCNLCEFSNGESISFSHPGSDRDIPLTMKEMKIDRDGVIYVFPSMILHYIEDHQYLPPKDFIDLAKQIMAESLDQITLLDMEFEPNYGFFNAIRNESVVDHQKVERYLKLLDSLEINELVERRLVRLLWSLPILLQWQVDRCERNGFKELAREIDGVLNKTFEILEEKMGLP